MAWNFSLRVFLLCGVGSAALGVCFLRARLKILGFLNFIQWAQAGLESFPWSWKPLHQLHSTMLPARASLLCSSGTAIAHSALWNQTPLEGTLRHRISRLWSQTLGVRRGQGTVVDNKLTNVCFQNRRLSVEFKDQRTGCHQCFPKETLNARMD